MSGGHESIEDSLLDQVKAYIKKEEPVMATSLTGAAFLAVGTFLIDHNLTDANTVVQSAEPAAVVVVLGVIGWLFRRFVDSPSTAASKAAAAVPPPATPAT